MICFNVLFEQSATSEYFLIAEQMLPLIMYIPLPQFCPQETEDQHIWNKIVIVKCYLHPRESRQLCISTLLNINSG